MCGEFANKYVKIFLYYYEDYYKRLRIIFFYSNSLYIFVIFCYLSHDVF